MNGWFSANGWSHSGSVSTGTKALLTKVSGKTTAKMIPCNASGVRTAAPAANADPGEGEPEEQHDADGQRVGGEPAFRPEADDQADHPHDRHRQGGPQQVGQRAPRQHG